MSAVDGARLADVPVQPDARTAHQWAVEELSKAVYHQQPSLWSRFLAWLEAQLAHLSGGAGGGVSTWWLLLALVVVAVVVLLVLGPVRRSRQLAGPAAAVLSDSDHRSSDAIRAAAAAAESAGDLALACAEWFRAVVRGLEERTLLDPVPGRTAREAAAAAGVVLSAVADPLATGARRFDALVYGHRVADAADVAAMRALDGEVRRARPPRPVGVPG